MSARSDVFRSLHDIPAGKVVTYGSLAARVGISNPRHVGYILHRNPDPRTYPCHRVVRASGQLASAYAFGGASAQKAMLLSEGVPFKTADRVDMKRGQFFF